MMLTKKVWEGLGMSAELRDIEEARYLDPQEEMAHQRAKMDFAGYWRGLAAEFLSVHPHAIQAKQALRHTFDDIEKDAEGGFDENEQGLIDHFMGQVDEAIVAVSAQSKFQQKLHLALFRTPGPIKAILFTVVMTALTVGVVMLIASMVEN